jgi:hypothetical protein
MRDYHLGQQELHAGAASVARRVRERFNIRYIDRGTTALLHRLGCRYKKPKLLLGKAADPEVREDFIAAYKQLEDNKGDRCRPVHGYDPPTAQSDPRGRLDQERSAPPTQERHQQQRLNINGVNDMQAMGTLIRYDDTIEVESTIALFKQIEADYPKAARITALCGNVRCYRSKAVRAFLKGSGIDLQPLPPYVPTLNLIER